jgi:hypothetical protein
LRSKINKSKNAIDNIIDGLDESDNDTCTNPVSEEKESRLNRLEDENKELKETIVELAIDLYGNKDKV